MSGRDEEVPWHLKVKVMLTCTKDWLPEDEVEFLDISEDFQGRDVLTFKCPKCGEKHESFRVA